MPSISNTETPRIPNTPKTHPKEFFNTTKNTIANKIRVATSFQIRKAKEE